MAVWRRFGGEKLGVDCVVFRPEGFDRASEGEDVLAIQAVVGGWGGGEPVGAVFDGVFGVLADEFAGIGVACIAADMFQAPVEGLDATIVVGGPAAVLVAADFAFKPVHEEVDS